MALSDLYRLMNSLYGSINAAKALSGDKTAPSVLTFTPADNSANIAIDADLGIIFSETVQKGNGIIYIKKVSDGTTVQAINVASPNVTVNDTVVTINPTFDLSGETDYYIEITSAAFIDLANNNFAGISGTTGWNFTTADVTAPILNSFTPTDGTTNATPNTNFVMNFNEPVQAGTGRVFLKRVADNSVSEEIDITSANVTFAGNQLTLNPTSDLVDGVEYYIEIDNGAITDLSNNSFAGISGNTFWNFTTSDVIAPVISNLSPADNGVGVLPTANLIVTFNEAIQQGSGNLVIKQLSDNAIVETIGITSANVAIAGNQLTINPSSDLAENTDYYVEIESGAILDLANNSFAGISGNTPWNFKTTDLTAPVVSSFSPTDNNTNVAADANLVINFNEAVQAGTGNIFIRRLSDNVAVETLNAASANVNISGTSVTINPTNDLILGSSYYVEVDSGAIKDLSNNNFAGISGNTTWNFAVADSVAPIVTSFTPTDNATGVAANSNLVMNFDEAIQKGTGNLIIKRTADNSTFETINVTSAEVTVSGNQLTVDPTSDLEEGAGYYVQIDNGAIADIFSNDYVGIADSTTWNFTVANIAPTATSFTPADNATAISTTADLVINFSEPVQKGTGNILIKQTSNGTTVATIDVTSANVTISGNAVTINPSSDLASVTGYYVEIPNTAILDLAGNSYAGLSGNAAWNFTTVSTIMGTAANDVKNGTSNADVMYGLDGNDTLNASSGNDTLYGGNGNDSLAGAGGADQHYGGMGDDTCWVDNTGDVVIEALNEGTDLIQASVTYTLPAHVENLTLIGTAASGTGNELANTLVGTGSANTLNGNEGNDSLSGLVGLDTLNGGDGNDTLDGGGGNDSLTGGSGADQFIYSTTTAFSTTNIGTDTIADFTSADGDKIVLDKTTFNTLSSAVGPGFSVATDFAIVTTDADAATSSARIVYNSTNGALFYNQNGATAGFAPTAAAGGQFATLTGVPTLSSTDFLIQA